MSSITSSSKICFKIYLLRCFKHERRKRRCLVSENHVQSLHLCRNSLRAEVHSRNPSSCKVIESALCPVIRGIPCWQYLRFFFYWISILVLAPAGWTRIQRIEMEVRKASQPSQRRKSKKGRVQTWHRADCSLATSIDIV